MTSTQLFPSPLGHLRMWISCFTNRFRLHPRHFVRLYPNTEVPLVILEGQKMPHDNILIIILQPI